MFWFLAVSWPESIPKIARWLLLQSGSLPRNRPSDSQSNCVLPIYILVNSHAAQIPIASRQMLLNSLRGIQYCFITTIAVQMRRRLFCNADPLEHHHFLTFRGHYFCVGFAFHSKESLDLECLAFPCEPHPHLCLNVCMLSFGAMVVGAPAPFATVAFPMCQVEVRRSHSLIWICYSTVAVLTVSFSTVRVYIFPFRGRCLSVGWSYGPFASIRHCISIIFVGQFAITVNIAFPLQRCRDM